MAKNEGENAKRKLLDAGTELMLRNGYVATTVDQICHSAGLTKGAFFYHFESKEALAESCLHEWPNKIAHLHRSADYRSIQDPVEKVLASIDFMIELFCRPEVQKSCLAGTTVQEVSETNPVLREAAQRCFVKGQLLFQSMLDDACRSQCITLDTASLAQLWMATMQGSLLLWKASRDSSAISQSLTHLKRYIASLLTNSVSK